MKKLIFISVLFPVYFLFSTTNCKAQWMWMPVYDTTYGMHIYIGNGPVRVLRYDSIGNATFPKHFIGIGGEFDTLIRDTANAWLHGCVTAVPCSPLLTFDGSYMGDGYGDGYPLNGSNGPMKPSVWAIPESVGSDTTCIGIWSACGGRFDGVGGTSIFDVDIVGNPQNITFWNFGLPDDQYCYTGAFTHMDTVFALSMLLIPDSLGCTPNLKTYIAARCVFCNGTSITDSSKYIGMYDPYPLPSLEYHFMNGGTNGPVYAIDAYDVTHVYAGGRFDTAGGIKANNVAIWNSVSWDSLGSGTNGTVKALLIYNNKLYVGGDFTMAGGIVVNNIAVWDGSSWSALGTGTSGPVYALTFYRGNLYAGGSFAKAGGHTVNNIAEWDGTNWSALSGGRSSDVYALASFNGDLYAGGKFLGGSNDTARYLAKYTNPQLVGINKISKNNIGVAVYPNPTIDRITVSSGSMQEAVIEISNIQGQLIETFTTTGNKTNLDVSNFANGVYFIKATTAKGVVVKRFIKE